MITNEIWNKGLTLQEYIGRMDIFQKEMQQRVNDIRITSAEFQKLKDFNPVRKMLVITEAWCMDSLMNVPVIAKIVEASPNITMKIIFRHEHSGIVSIFFRTGVRQYSLMLDHVRRFFILWGLGRKASISISKVGWVEKGSS